MKTSANEIVNKKNKRTAIEALATRLSVSSAVLEKTLKATAFKDCKTNEEFAAAVIVANTYRLNPLLNEIYAFAAKKGGVVPIVSTDGWTKLMTGHENYKTHSFKYSEKMVTMKGAKPCPEWCEIDIEKKDGSHIIIREYLDEVFRELTYFNPWQTHTKRFLRHKTKIQGAREAFGFSGIYDQDEGERITEAQGTEVLASSDNEEIPLLASPEQQAIELASIEQIENLKKIAGQAKLIDADLLDFIVAQGIKDPDRMTMKEYQVCLQAVMAKLDADTKK